MNKLKKLIKKPHLILKRLKQLKILILTLSAKEIIEIAKVLKTVKEPKNLLRSLLDLTDNGFMNIDIMTYGLEDIAYKFSKRKIDNLAFSKHSIDKTSKKELQIYADERIGQALQEGVKKFKSRKKTFSVNLAEEAYLNIKQILDEKHIAFFLVSESLLGAVRNGGFMENDYNVDLGYFDEQIATDELKEILLSSGKFILTDTFGNYGFALKHFNGIETDFFNHFIDSHALCHRTAIHKWYNTPFTLNKIDFAGSSALVPSNYNLYLSENYGNWSDKVAFYDFSFDTPNVKYDNSIETLEYFYGRIKKGITKGQRKNFLCSNKALKEAFGMDFLEHYPTTADGYVKDYREPRLQLYILDTNSITDYEKLIKNMIEYVKGTNIKLDIALVGNVMQDNLMLEEFDFCNSVTRYNTLEELENKNLKHYDKIVLGENITQEKFKEFPNTKLS